MKHLSLLSALLISSSMVYAGWITKGTDYKGDCLEMMCDCVKDDERNGYCCPDGTAFNGKGDAHIEYTPCKCLEANTYYNTTSKKCSEKPTCNPCQKLDVAIGTCVADTSKNNRQIQDACHVCQNGNVVLKDEEKNIPCDSLCCSKNQTCNKGKCETPVPQISHWTFCGYPGWGIWEIHSGGPYSVDLVLKGELYYADDILYVYVDGKQKFTHSSYNYGCLDSKCAKHWSVDIPKGAKWSVKLYNGGENLACAPGKTWLELPK